MPINLATVSEYSIVDGMRVMPSSLFPVTPTIAQGKADVNSWCRGEQ